MPLGGKHHTVASLLVVAAGAVRDWPTAGVLGRWETYLVRTEPRELTATERAVLERLLRGDSDDATRLREQLEGLKVVGRCDCGCPTIDFDTAAAAPDATSRLVGLEGTAAIAPGEPPVEILMFETDGLLGSLELVSYGDHVRADWPPVESIEVRATAR